MWTSCCGGKGCSFCRPVHDPLNKMGIDKPHDPWGSHVDVVTTLPDIGGAHKIRIGKEGQILTEVVHVGKKKFSP